MADLERVTPPPYRCFSRPEFAEAFLNGVFRLGSIRRYREIEDANRQDTEEGLGHFKDEGGDRYPELGNEIFILCLSTPDVDQEYLKAKMGGYVVKICDANALARDIEEGLNKIELKVFGGIRGRHVRYDKAMKLCIQDDAWARAELSVIQKPEVYKSECEYRYFAILNRDVPNVNQRFLELKLERRLEYVELQFP